jgi:hypothetical protein
MDVARQLSEGVAAWLQYQFFCDRSRLFNERYMSVPIANILHAIYRLEVHSEFLHPVLAAEKKGPGRRPEVDFAVVEQYPTIKCAIESKWLGKTGLSADQVVWDLLRLELIAAEAKASAFFLIAGRRKHLETFFQSKAFLGEPKGDKYRRLLKLDGRRNARIRVDAPPPDRLPMFQSLFKNYQYTSFSSRVTTSICHVYPKDCPMFQYQVYTWRVFSPPNTPRFLPKDHSFYSADTEPSTDKRFKAVGC